jgi:hypothetical protein
MATAESTLPDDGTIARGLRDMVRVMFPHPSFPDGPYERCAQAILESSHSDVRLRAQLEQGLRDLDVVGGAPFAELAPEKALEVLRSISATTFFAEVRGQVITSLYDDREVWSLLGYEGPSYDQGGYLNRGFDDLDWLPDPKIEQEAGA